MSQVSQEVLKKEKEDLELEPVDFSQSKDAISHPGFSELASRQRTLDSEGGDDIETSNSDAIKEDLQVFRALIKDPTDREALVSLAKILNLNQKCPEVFAFVETENGSRQDITSYAAYMYISMLCPDVETDPKGQDIINAYKTQKISATELHRQVLQEFPNQSAEKDKKLLKYLRTLLTHETAEGTTLLFEAAEHTDYYFAEFLLLCGAAECVDWFCQDLIKSRRRSPLTVAVQKLAQAYQKGESEDIISDKQYVLELLLYFSDQPVDALCAAIDLQDDSTLKYLLNLDVIKENINESDSWGRYPLLMACKLCNQHVFTSLLHEGAKVDGRFQKGSPRHRQGAEISELFQENNSQVDESVEVEEQPQENTSILHEAVRGAESNADIDFFNYLLGIRPDLLARVDKEGETPLSLACALGKIGLIEKMTSAQFICQREIHGLDRSLMIASYYGDSAVLNLLFSQCPLQCLDLLMRWANWVDFDHNPYGLALQQERSDILSDNDPSEQSDWSGFQELFLTFAHSRKDTFLRNKLFEIECNGAEKAIKGVVDVDTRESMLAMLEQLRSDYTFNIPGEPNEKEFKEAIKQNNKILGVMNELRYAATDIKAGRDPAEVKSRLVRCCSNKMYSGRIKEFLIIVGCALLGAITFGVPVALGCGLAAGPPGAVVGGAIATKGGLTAGAAVGATVAASVVGAGAGGAAGAAVPPSKVFQTIRWQLGLWKVNRALNKKMAEDARRLLDRQDSASEHSNDDIGFERSFR